MPVVSYPLDPTGFGIALAQATADNIFSLNWPQADGNCSLGMDTKFFIQNNSFSRFLIGGFTPIPPKAYIRSALLRFTSLVASTTPAWVDACAVARDGQWEAGSTTSYTPAPDQDMVLQVRNVGATVDLIPQTHTSPVNTSPWTPNALLIEVLTRVGQCATVVNAGNLGSVIATLGRSGSQAGSVFCEVYAAAANDGSNDRPTGAILATSAALSFNSLSTGLTGAPATFTFSGANQIALAAGNRYVFVFRDTTASGGALLRVFYNESNAYSGGSLVVGTTLLGVSRTRYPQRNQLPHLHPWLSTAIDNAPHGPIAELQIPLFGAPGSTTDVPGLHSILQAWVDDPLYATNQPILIHLSPNMNAENFVSGILRQWSSVALVVDWEVPSASGQVVVPAAAAQSNAGAAAVIVPASSSALQEMFGSASLAVVVRRASTTFFAHGLAKGAARALAFAAGVGRALAIVSGRAGAGARASGSTGAGARASGRATVGSKVSGSGSIE